MDYLLLLQKESEDISSQLALIGALESVANVVLMATVIAAANGETETFSQTQLAIIFSLCLLIFLIFRAKLLDKITGIVEGVVRKLRMRITNRIRHAELVSIDAIGRPDILQVLAQDCQTLYDAAHDVLISCGQIAVLLCSIGYLALISFDAFLAVGGALAAGLLVFTRHYRSIQVGFENARREEQNFFDILSDQLEGFKELRIHEDKAQDFYENDITLSARKTERLKLAAAAQTNIGTNLSQAVFFVLLGGIVFVLPKLMEPGMTSAVTISKIVAVFLFIDAPVELIARTLPIYIRANVAARKIALLDKRLSELTLEESEPLARAVNFQSLRCRQLAFRYPSQPGRPEDSFHIGPLNLEIRRGEILFLVGGNGSGKSTLLNLLCGLLVPTSGQLMINGTVGIREQRALYRSYFATILQDYHLFRRLLGHSRTNRDRVESLLKKMHLDGVTQVDEQGRFTNLRLSAGQRKRLALLVTECDDREVLILDEWGADQDPAFRRYFYEEYLPELRSRGKTVIAATHDDDYFHVADRLIQMSREGVTELPPGRGPLRPAAETPAPRGEDEAAKERARNTT